MYNRLSEIRVWFAHGREDDSLFYTLGKGEKRNTEIALRDTEHGRVVNVTHSLRYNVCIRKLRVIIYYNKILTSRC